MTGRKSSGSDSSTTPPASCYDWFCTSVHSLCTVISTFIALSVKIRLAILHPSHILARNGKRQETRRKLMSKFMMVSRKLGECHEAFSEVTLDLVDILRQERGKEDKVFLDVPEALNRWSFECS